MARETFEFYCNDCIGWFLVNLNIAKRGDILVVCPNCAHEHPRSIADGKILADDDVWGYKDHDQNRYKTKKRVVTRACQDQKTAERIVPMKSSYSKKPRLHLLEKVRGGFLAESWMRKAAGEEGIDG